MRGLSAVPLGVLVAGLGVAGVRAGAAQQIPVRVGGMTSSFVGVAFDVPLEVDLSARSDKLGSFALTLRWNPAVLRFVRGQNGTFGDLKGGDSTVAVDSGLIRLTGVNPGGVGGHVVLGVGRFVPLTADTTTFRLDLTELYAAGSFADLLPSAVWANQPYCPAVGRFGDMNNDQTVNSADALQALSLAAGLTITGNAALGDVDGDGATNARDALLMLSAGVGLDVGGFRVFLVAPGGCAAPRRPLLAVTPGNLTLDVAQQARYTAFASDSTGAALAVTDLVWQTSDSLVARVTSAGQVTAVAPGLATITVRRTSGTSASATVTVLHRHTHWVDALASPEEFNQLGAPELPFRTIPQALAYAGSGDTVRVRSGRYDDTLAIVRPVVLIGDTTGGKPRPLLSAFWSGSPGITVQTPGRVELQALRLDTLAVGVAVGRVDTLLVRWMEFRASSQTYQTPLFVDTAGVVLIQRSAFFGPGTQYYYANDGIVVDSAAVVSIDSSYVAEFGYNGVVLYNVDSVSVRGSRIGDNYGYGVYYCAQCYGTGVASNAVFSGNRFVRNYYGHVYVDNAKTVRFDHNRAVAAGNYYDGYTVSGDTATTLVTLLGDSVAITNYGYWLSLTNFDSLAVDSTLVVVGEGYPSISGGRAVSIRDSRFLNVTGEALDVDAYPRDSTRLHLRRVEFLGADSSSCDRCGDMIYGYSLNLDADSVRMVNAYYGFDLNYSRLALRHVTLEHYSYGVAMDCGSVNVAQASFTGGYYGVELYGCGAADSAVVDSVAFGNHSSSALYSSGAAATLVSRSQFTNTYYAIEHDCGQLRVSNVAASGGYYGINAYGCAVDDSLLVDQSSFAGFTYGADLENSPSRVTSSVFTDDSYGLYLYAPGLVSGNQFVRPGNNGIYHYWYSGASGSTQFVNNTVSCDALGASNAEGLYVYRPSYPGSDTVTVTGNTIGNCNSGIYLTGGQWTFVRGNTVGLPTSVAGYRGIYVDSDSSSEVVANVVSGAGAQGSINVQSVRSARVDSNTVSNALAAGLLFPGVYDSLRVRDNSITGLQYGCCGVSPSGAIELSGGAAATNVLAEIRRNRISDVTNGIVLQRGSGDTVTVQVDSNAIRGADSMGVWVKYYSRARLLYNAIDSSGVDAVHVSDNYLALPSTVANANNLTHSKAYGVRNLSTYPADATGNWWGDAKGPTCVSSVGCDTTSTGDSVSTFVTFGSPLANPVTTLLPAPRLLATASFTRPTAAASLTGGAAPVGTWDRPPAAPPQRQRARSAGLATSAASPPSAPGGAHAATVRLEAVTQTLAARVDARQAERARLLARWEARQSAHQQDRARREQGRAAREAARQAREPAPRRPQ